MASITIGMLITDAIVASLSVGLSIALEYAFPQHTDASSSGPKIGGLGVTSSALGEVIPEIWGAARVAGNIIWSSGIKEHVHVTTQTYGGGKASQTITRTTYTYTVDLAVALARGPQLGVRTIRVGGNAIYYVGTDASADTMTASIAFRDAHLTFYPGDGTTLPDSVIEAMEGVGNVPGFRDLAILMIEDWDITKYGGIPPLTFEVVQSGVVSGDNLTPAPIDVATIIQELSVRAGFLAVNIDTTEVTGSVAGYMISSQSSYRDALQPLLGSQFIDVVESGGGIVFRARQGAVVLTIPPSDLAAQPEGGNPSSPVITTLGDPNALPGTVSVRYSDQDLNYQPNVQSVHLEEGNENNEDTISLPIVMTATAARQLADSIKSAAWIERETYHFKLPLSYIALEPADKVQITVDGVVITVRIVNVALGADNVIDIEAVRHDNSIYTSTIAAAVVLAETPVVDTAGATTTYLLDIAALRDADAVAGFYAAACGANPGWKSALLFQSVDGGTTYDRFLLLDAYTILGATTTALPAAQHDTWDDVSTVDVTLLRGSIIGATDLSVINGANFILIADEIVQFGVVTPLGGLGYRLSRLLRGRRGTEWAIGTHAIGDRAILLNTAYRGVEQVADIGRYDNWKMVANGQLITAITSIAFRNTGESLRPYSPVWLAGTRDATTGDLTITWIRRSRLGHTLMSNQDIPLGETVEKYEVDILSAGAAVRTLTATTPTAVYLGADQTTDFGAWQAAVAVNAYQISAQVGRGRPVGATI